MWVWASSDGLRWVLVSSGAALVGSGWFLWVLVSSGVVWWVLVSSGAVLGVLGSGGLW